MSFGGNPRRIVDLWKTGEAILSLSKPIIDEIDKVLAELYGFTDEELDFIINYDIKYRMGADSGGDEVDDQEAHKQGG